jgi:Transglutaminase-like superfamily/Coenzyme PQQ synthesis protein D (PqqD)
MVSISKKKRQPIWSAQEVMVSTDANGRTVIFHIPSGTYLGLDAAASQIVDLLNRYPDLESAARELANRFGISEAQARNDVGLVIDAVGTLSAPRTKRGRLPSYSGARSVFAAWRRQKWPFRLLIVKVTAVVVVVEVGLKVTDVATLAERMKVPLATESASSTVVPLEHLRELGEHEQRLYLALRWVMDRWLYDGTCLRRSLTLGWFLRREHPVLRLGMTNENDAVAHAWIEVGGKSIDSQSVTMDFTTFSTG